ncbi:MAG: efflux RND transporter periplasmic adaptor subunit [Planctomycetaceae bacterium]|nr:efflux RND transporter periplasmic adaptor subunit [Planctomycetales bacterium]MCB9874539.1 efflux RND transporter periplasmic adaptor subunit [Planctomycetaceae bacterium]MCB9941589.1 efflux RND transporter periplasmic adaptor subunit [Planctomycetaceae bacterium]
MNATQSPSFWQLAWKPVIGLAILGSVVALATAGWSLLQDMGDTKAAYVYYTVEPMDLPIVVTERGNLESQLETKVRCDVESSSYDRNSSGTTIIFIVPNGSAVKEGDLLVELDSAAIRDRLDSEQLAFDKAVSQRIQAQATYDNQITENQTNQAQAELRVELAKLEREMYMDSENGTFKLSLEDIERQIDESKNLILESQAALELEKAEKSGIEALFKLGYRGKSDLEQSRFRFMQSEDKLASSVNRLSTYQSTRKQLEEYEFRMQKMQLDGDVATAEQSLVQTKTTNMAQLAKAEAAKNEAEKTEKSQRERLEKLREQLTLCKIYAPHDGMVVYARENSRYGSSTDIAEGASVRQRQELITLPDLSQMQVKTQIHEAVLDQITAGLPVTVKIEAYSNRTYDGVVASVAVVPTSSYYTSVKTYDCMIRIQERVENLKPGMTAVVDIHVDRLEGVLSIPVQAVAQVKKDTWCYVHSDEGVERRLIKLGRSNDKFVQVIEGLSAGDRVILNTDAIFDEAEEGANEISPESGVEEAPVVALPETDTQLAAEPQAVSLSSEPQKVDRPRGKGKQRPTE